MIMSNDKQRRTQIIGRIKMDILRITIINEDINITMVTLMVIIIIIMAITEIMADMVIITI